MSYKEPDSVLLILKRAQQVRLAILDGHRFDREDSPVQQKSDHNSDDYGDNN